MYGSYRVNHKIFVILFMLQKINLFLLILLFAFKINKTMDCFIYKN